MTASIKSAFRNCMFGAAVGDAIGAPVEFMSIEAIRQNFGAKGINGYAPCYGGIGRFTDDTQMSLFTAEGLCRANANGTDFIGAGAQALINWLWTQGDKNPSIPAEMDGMINLFRNGDNRRAPGNTCLSALRSMPSLGAPAHNDSKGCGTVMRAHPVGLFGYARGMTPAETFKLASDLCALTHGHPSGYLSGGVMAVIVQQLLAGKDLKEACQGAVNILAEYPGHGEVMAAMHSALATDMYSDPFTQLGEGWVAEEALAIGVYCALNATSFTEGVLMAANHSGDSDSTASIAGALLGITHGDEIPGEWLEELEMNEFIAAVGDSLYLGHP